MSVTYVHYTMSVKCSTRHNPTHPRTPSSPAGDSSLKAIEKLDKTIHKNPAKKNNLWQVTWYKLEQKRLLVAINTQLIHSVYVSVHTS